MNSNALEAAQLKVAVLTTMNTVCGIAEYSRDLYSPIKDSFAEFHFVANRDVADRTRPDADDVLRLWVYGETEFGDVLSWLASARPDVLHIQLHSEGHFPQTGLVKLLQGIRKLPYSLAVVITPHTVRSSSYDLGTIRSELQHVARILVHKQKDFDYLQSLKLENLRLFPHPFDVYPQRPKSTLRSQLGIATSPVIVTHGLISQHKGLLETAAAIAKLKQSYPDVLWLAVNAVNMNNTTSAATFEQLQQQVQALHINDNVRLFPEFISAEEIMLLIQSADVGLCVYSEVGESASAAVRKFLASGIPTIVTDIPMMQELDAEVLKIENNKPETITASVRYLLAHPESSGEITRAALAKSNSRSWKVMGQELAQIYTSL